MMIKLDEETAKAAISIVLVIFLLFFLFMMGKLIKKIIKGNSRYKFLCVILAFIYASLQLVFSISLFMFATLMVTLPLSEEGFKSSVLMFIQTDDGILAKKMGIIAAITLIASMLFKIIIVNLVKIKPKDPTYEELFSEEDEEELEKQSEKEEKKNEETIDDYLERIREEKRKRAEVLERAQAEKEEKNSESTNTKKEDTSEVIDLDYSDEETETNTKQTNIEEQKNNEENSEEKKEENNVIEVTQKVTLEEVTNNDIYD